MTISYSKKVKDSLSDISPRKKCCERIERDVFTLDKIDNPVERAKKILLLPKFFKCLGCRSRALAALFIQYGSVTDPNKQYHMEFSLKTEEERDAIYTLLFNLGFEMKKTTRKNRYIVYIKRSEKISDFFAFVGANKVTFDLINTKIIHEVRGDANRQMNCDVANINKAIKAAENILFMISEMRNNLQLSRLPKELYETATLRYENTQSSLAELAMLHNPPISKSGVKHRLDKIEEYYNKFKNEK